MAYRSKPNIFHEEGSDKGIIETYERMCTVSVKQVSKTIADTFLLV
jgi:hypothetical protein